MIGLAFTPEQFKTLLAMIYIANTVVNGHREKEYLKEYDELEQYIFSRAGAAGYPGATWSHKTHGVSASASSTEEHHHPSKIFESDPLIAKIMDEYDQAMAMGILAEMLATRDIEQKYGPGAKERMVAEEYDALFEHIAEEYETEFERFGLAKVSVAKEGRNDLPA